MVIDSPQRKDSCLTPTVARKIVCQHPGAATGYAGSAMGRVLRVLFVDDHQVMRRGLVGLISGKLDIQLVGEAANGWEAVEQARKLKPDVVVMDLSMRVMDGIEATRQLKAEFPDVQVICLSMFDNDLIARKMRQAGAETFVSKTASASDMLKAIDQIRHRQKA